MRVRRFIFGYFTAAMTAAVFLLLLIASPAVFAQGTDEGGFVLQVSPSPIISTVKPGVSSSNEFQIRNSGTKKEELKVELRKFKVDENNGQIELTEELPKEVSDWVKISNPIVSIEPGTSFTETMTTSPPADVGFSYSFAVVISRNKEPVTTPGKTALKGSIAVFTLLTVDRPGAVRKFDISEFSTNRRVYEFLPVNFQIKLKNTGNTIVLPYGNVYIQKSATDNKPLSVLKVNDTGSYLLPGVTRAYPAIWVDGFPVYQTTSEAKNTKLSWDWSKAQNFRFGKYYAKLVAVYNDGQRDVPVEATISFWIIPWKFILVGLALLIVLIIGLITIIRKPYRSIKNKKKKSHSSTQDTKEDEA